MELRNVLKHDGFELFDFEYDIDSIEWKEKLEQKIIDYFFFHEIGQESIDRFKHRFRTKIQSIMSYYNELYKTTLFDNDPLTTQRLKEVLEEENTGTQKVEGENEGDIKTSDFPQSQNLDEDILAGQQTNKDKNQQTRTDNLKHKQERIIEGYARIPYPELLKMHRDTLLRIDGMIIQELKTLFILVY